MIIRYAAPFALVLSVMSPARAEPASGLDRPVLLHGNYCGPGNNAPLAPIDALDAACARHDACTPRGHMPGKACNLRLEREAEAVSRDPRQPGDLRALAGLVAAGAAMFPSEGDGIATTGAIPGDGPHRSLRPSFEAMPIAGDAADDPDPEN